MAPAPMSNPQTKYEPDRLSVQLQQEEAKPNLAVLESDVVLEKNGSRSSSKGTPYAETRQLHPDHPDDDNTRQSLEVTGP